MAGIREWRVALLISILCMAAITIAVLWPDLITSGTAAKPPSHYQVPAEPPQPTQDQPATPAPTAAKATIIRPEAGKPKTPVQTAKTKSAVGGATTQTKPAPPPPAKTTSVAKQPPANGYYLQLATFRDRALASRLADKLKPTHLHLQLVEKKGMYAVWAGPWATREQADASKQTIYKQTGLNGFVIRK